MQLLTIRVSLIFNIPLFCLTVHGTHCAGILAGNGYSSKGKYKGIALEANILSVKVLDESGNGNTSDILSTVQWIIENREVYKTRINQFFPGSHCSVQGKKRPSG
jgi:serine protease AprX